MSQTVSTGHDPSAKGATVIECHRITKRFNNQQVLGSLSFSLDRSKVVCFVGPSGCGKTTALKTAAGLIQPDPPGRVRWFSEGKELPGAFRPLSVVQQGNQLLPWRTVIGNVTLPLEVSGVPRDSRLERAHAALSDVGLGEEIHWGKYPHELSGGMRTRVALAAAIVVPSPVMLLDEPLTALDDWRKQELVLLLAQLFRKQDRAVLYVTHDIEDGVFVSDEIIAFRNPAIGDFERIGVPCDWERTPDLRFAPPFRELVESVCIAAKTS